MCTVQIFRVLMIVVLLSFILKARTTHFHVLGLTLSLLFVSTNRSKYPTAVLSWCHTMSIIPRHGYFDEIEVPMTDQAVDIGILVLGRDWCRHKLWRPINFELTK